jgi:hypothetical protein
VSFRTTLAGAALAAAALALPAAAQAGCNLKTIDVPVEMKGLRPIVTAKIGGTPVKLMLDSGSFYNTLDSRFVADHGLRPAGRQVLGSRFKEAAASCRARSSSACRRRAKRARTACWARTSCTSSTTNTT